MDFLKSLVKWLALVLVVLALLVAGVMGWLYSQVDLGDLPEYSVSFGGEELRQCGYEWSVPVAGKWMSREFSRPQHGEPQQLQRAIDSHPQLAVPASTQGTLRIQNTQGETVFEGTVEEYAGFAFFADGVYTGLLQLGEEPDPLGLIVQPHGHYLYSFTFELLAQPSLTLSASSMVQGGVVGVKLTGALGEVPPSLSTELEPEAVFVRHGGSWLSYIPVDYNQPGGDYEISATVNGQTVSAAVNIYGRERRELDTYTIDGSAAIPYIGSTSKKLAEVLAVCDPDVYWSGAFTQPVSGKVVRDYAVLEYTDRIDAATLAIYPELAAVNELIEPRRSVNVTMAVTPGKKVLAPAAGRVVFAGTVDGGGRTVVIEHGCGLKSIVYLLGRISVNEGDYVAQNDVIGTTQGHVTCEMRLYDIPISPWEAWRGQGSLFWS